jgi:uncharacterized protein involved in exopolysaccharide biosynthesis
LEEKNLSDIDIHANGFAERNIDFFYLIGILWRYKIFIISTTFVVGVLSIIYVLVVTPQYMSVVTLYPVNKEDGGPLKQLAMSLGISNKTSGYYIYDVLMSKRISSEIVYTKYKSEFFPDSVNLIQFWELEDLPVSKNRILELAIRNLSGAVLIKEDKETSLINLSVVTKDKHISKAVAEKYCEATINYLNNEEQTSIKQSILFTENRLLDVRKKLLQDENDYVEFKKINARTNSPFLSMEEKRKVQDVELIRSVVVLLEKQLELLRIEEVKEKPIINILDKPDLRDKPVKPKKREVVMINTIISFFASFIIVIINEKAKKYRIYEKLINEIKTK